MGGQILMLPSESNKLFFVPTGITKAKLCTIFVCWMLHIKDSLLLIGNSSSWCDGRFPF